MSPRDLSLKFFFIISFVYITIINNKNGNNKKTFILSFL